MGSWTKYELIVLPIALAVIILTTILLWVLLKNKNYKTRSIPLKIIALILFVAEIVKQVLNFIKGYGLGAIPLHFCSLFVFFFPLSELFGEKVGKFFKPVSTVTATAMTLLFYFGPGSIIGDSPYDIFFTNMQFSNVSEFYNVFASYHTFFFHHLVILYFAINLALKLYTPEKKDFIKVFIVIETYVIIAMPLSHIIGVNFCNFAYSNIPFMESLRVACGQLVYSLVMHIVIAGGCALITYVYYLISNIITKKRS